ncbi:MAG: diguanylate cyclase [Burkholderiales bacterium]
MGRARPGALHIGLVFLLYLASGWLGVQLTVMREGLVILWLPNAVLLAALLRFGFARYWAVASAGMGAEVGLGWGTFSLPESLLFGAINLAEATLAFALLRRWRFDPQFGTPADLGKFVVVGPLACALGAAFAGGAVYLAFRGGETTYLEFVRIWWFGDGLGLLILTPLLLGFPPFGVAGWSPRRPAWLDAAAWAGLGAGLLFYWMDTGGEAGALRFGPVLVLPFVLLVAARLGRRWAALAVVIAALGIAVAVAQGRAPFGALAPREATMLAQEFMFVMALMALGLAALLGQQRDLREQLEMRVAERTGELTRANERLAELATHDDLTGLYNRRGLFELAQREFARARRTGRGLALVMADLDHFKEVNDRHGHLAGDRILKRCAAAHARLARASDLCGRFGGEEFLLLAPETDLEGAVALAERVRHSLREMDEDGIRVTASFGVTVLAESDRSLDDLLKRADDALYRAKSGGRDRVVAA